MSIQAIAWVLEESESEGLARLVLLAVANHADAQGWNAWPSVAQIGVEARVSRRTVFRAIEELVELGELSITHSGGGRGLTSHYHLPKLPQKRCQADTVSPENGVKRVSPVSKNGATPGTRTVLNREPARHAGAREGEGPSAPSEQGPTSDRENHGPRPSAFVAPPPATPEDRADALRKLRALRRGRETQ